MDKEQAIYVVESLNEDLFGTLGENFHVKNGWCFNYTTDGYSEYISFNDHILWSSKDDDREWDEEFGGYKETIYSYVLNKLQHLSTNINKFLTLIRIDE